MKDTHTIYKFPHFAHGTLRISWGVLFAYLAVFVEGAGRSDLQVILILMSSENVTPQCDVSATLEDQ